MGHDEWPKNHRPIKETKFLPLGYIWFWIDLVRFLAGWHYYISYQGTSLWTGHWPNLVKFCYSPSSTNIKGWNMWVKYFALLTHLQGMWPCSGILVIDPTRVAPVKFCYCQWVRVLLYWGGTTSGQLSGQARGEITSDPELRYTPRHQYTSPITWKWKVKSSDGCRQLLLSSLGQSPRRPVSPHTPSPQNLGRNIIFHIPQWRKVEQVQSCSIHCVHVHVVFW